MSLRKGKQRMPSLSLGFSPLSIPLYNLCSFSTVKDIWDYLKRVYKEDNVAKWFQLEIEIANYRQGILSIQEYYFWIS